MQGQLKTVRQIQAHDEAFAAILSDGSVVTWGEEDLDDSDLVSQLKKVKAIQASGHAFAAILGDGSVVTWGLAEYGGDSGAARRRLKNVQQIQASRSAFAAILGDGSVGVAWGHPRLGGDSSAVQGTTARCAADPSM